jgi:hypothetical protein
MLCSQRASRPQSTARCPCAQPCCSMTHACVTPPACIIKACNSGRQALTRLGCTVQASYQRYKEKKRERKLREQQEVHPAAFTLHYFHIWLSAPSLQDLHILGGPQPNSS